MVGGKILTKNVATDCGTPQSLQQVVPPLSLVIELLRGTEQAGIELDPSGEEGETSPKAQNPIAAFPRISICLN